MTVIISGIKLSTVLSYRRGTTAVVNGLTS
jgi:hypothetical protein